jgi:hypothetical protein
VPLLFERDRLGRALTEIWTARGGPLAGRLTSLHRGAAAWCRRAHDRMQLSCLHAGCAESWVDCGKPCSALNRALMTDCMGCSPCRLCASACIEVLQHGAGTLAIGCS